MRRRAEGPHPTALETWLERRLPPYGFGVMLVLLRATYLLMAWSPSQQSARVITVTGPGDVTE